MKRFPAIVVSISLLTAAAAFGAATATTKPAPLPGSFEAVQASGTAELKQYKLLVPGTEVLADANAEQRAKLAPQAIPMLKDILVDLKEMGRLKPSYKWPIVPLHDAQQAALYAFGDQPTVAQLDHQMKEPGREGLQAKHVVLRARWYMAGDDLAKQQAVITDIDSLAVAQPTDTVLATLVFDMCSSTKDTDTKQHLTDVLTNTLDSQTADACVHQLVLNDKMHSFNNKPMVLAGKTMEGKDFTSADWQGKVVLVDFWATWCVPCRAELPRVQKVYADYHDKGFEVLGISNDESQTQLVKISNMLKLPWPQLFDADAAAKGAWHPITTSHGINGIPVMFLIDKKGICRTVTARDNFETMIPQLLAE